MDILDSLGRTVEESNYKKNVLLQKQLFQYNDQNDKISEINAYDINNPKRTDTTTYQYEYREGCIVFEKSISSNGHCHIYKILSKEDSIYKYQYINYLDIYKNRRVDTSLFILTYNKDGQVTKNEWQDGKSKTIRYQTYYPNKLLEWYDVEYIPSLPINIYVGVPKSASFQYDYDKKGRVKTSYIIIGNKKLKQYSYKYVR